MLGKKNIWKKYLLGLKSTKKKFKIELVIYQICAK